VKAKDRHGDGSANWQFAPLNQRALCQTKVLSSIAQLRSMSDRGSGANCQFALPFSIAPYPWIWAKVRATAKISPALKTLAKSESPLPLRKKSCHVYFSKTISLSHSYVCSELIARITGGKIC